MALSATMVRAREPGCRKIFPMNCTFACRDSISDMGSMSASIDEPQVWQPRRFEGLQQQSVPRRPGIDPAVEAEPPPLKSPENDKEKETADCPICCEDLGRSPQEVGALTYQGKRIERDLYHVGCFTLMLSHKGAFRGERLKDGYLENLKISWGQSPTTRQPVDGFVSMPSMADRTALVSFMDWKSTGRIDVAELATIAAVQLPLSSSAMEGFIRENFQVDKNGDISTDELQMKVLPYIAEHFESITNAREEEKRRAAKLRSEFLLMRLDAATSTSCASSSAKWMQAALDELSYCVAEGDATAIRVLARLIAHDEEEEVRQKAAQLIPKVATRGDPQAFEVLSQALQHRSSRVRATALEVLPQVCMSGDRRAFEEVSLRLHDRSPHVQVAAAHALAKIADFEDKEAVEVLCGKLHASSPGVCCAVLEVLPQLAAPCSEPALGAARRALEAPGAEPTVQVAALISLMALAPGDEAALQAGTRSGLGGQSAGADWCRPGRAMLWAFVLASTAVAGGVGPSRENDFHRYLPSAKSTPGDGNYQQYMKHWGG
ncbi:unnamed protein product [Effrenium voratum]|nr:unnamed protein product [Effrenium voratum]